MQAHRTDLLDIGVPLGVTETQHRWGYFLEHGYDYQSGWSVEALEPLQAKRLKTLLSEYAVKDAAYLLPTLNRLASGKEE